MNEPFKRGNNLNKFHTKKNNENQFNFIIDLKGDGKK